MTESQDTPPDRVDRDAMRAELERIMRTSKNDSARISAIRQLREMDREDGEDGEQPAEEGEVVDLYSVEPIRKRA